MCVCVETSALHCGCSGWTSVGGGVGGLHVCAHTQGTSAPCRTRSAGPSAGGEGAMGSEEAPGAGSQLRAGQEERAVSQKAVAGAGVPGLLASWRGLGHGQGAPCLLLPAWVRGGSDPVSAVPRCSYSARLIDELERKSFLPPFGLSEPRLSSPSLVLPFPLFASPPLWSWETQPCCRPAFP